MTVSGKLYFLHPHLSSGHDVGDDVLLRGLEVDPVGPLADGDHLPALLVGVGRFPGLVDKGAELEPGDLTPADVRTLEVGVQQQVEVEGDLLARVVHAHVHVQLLLAQDQPVGDAKLAVPH